MRFDLIINTMVKTVLTENIIVINNPYISRPILDIRDALEAYRKAVEADYSISGIFNIASGNYTVGEVGNRVKTFMEKYLKKKIQIDTKDIPDMRDYKVSIKKAKEYLGFIPSYSIEDTIKDIIDHKNEYKDFDDDRYYNIRIFKKMLDKKKAENKIFI